MPLLPLITDYQILNNESNPLSVVTVAEQYQSAPLLQFLVIEIAVSNLRNINLYLNLDLVASNFPNSPRFPISKNIAIAPYALAICPLKKLSLKPFQRLEFSCTAIPPAGDSGDVQDSSWIAPGSWGSINWISPSSPVGGGSTPPVEPSIAIFVTSVVKI